MQKFQTSLVPDKNLQILIESFNQSQKNPGNIPRQRYQMPYMRPPGAQAQVLTILQEKVSISLIQNANINTVLTNEQQDIMLKLSMGQKLIQIITIDRPSKEQKEEEQQVQQVQPFMPQIQFKQRIEFKIEDNDEIEINGTDGTITILTKSNIKQVKNDQNKKPIQSVQNDILNKNDQQIVQIQIKFLKDWHVKISSNPQSAKKQLQDFFRSFQLQKIKFIAFDNQQQIEPPPLTTITEKTVIKQTDEVREPEVPPISDKDLQYLFPPVTEEFVQRQKESLERKNLSTDEKIKRLLEEVRIKQFKQQTFSADKNMYKCPYHKCQKGYKKPNQLKVHLRNNHQKLSEIGLVIDDNGEYQFNEKALDYCLILWKVYPNFVKSVINEMKQRKDQPSA